MIFKTKEELRTRLNYLWDYTSKRSDVEHLLRELWKDIEDTRNEVKNLVKPDVSGNEALRVAVCEHADRLIASQNDYYCHLCDSWKKDREQTDR